MSREIEIEFKNLLTKAEFERLCRFFHITCDHFTLQHNYYFDTPSLMLKNRGCALRVREKNGRSILTLKQPHREGLLETHQSLTEREAREARADSRFPKGEVVQALLEMKVPPGSLRLLGKLSTARAETVYHNGTLAFDHSFYLQTEDYELEYESRESTSGEKTFLKLLKEFQIPRRDAKNKIRRFFEQKTLYGE